MSVVTDFYSDGREKQDRECVIFVEGTDDALFLSSILEAIGANSGKVGIVAVGGKEKFQSALTLFIKGSAFRQGGSKSVAIICDADENPEKAAGSINLALSLNRQPKLKSGEIVVNEKGVKLGLFIFPDGENPGDLESLCLDTIKDDELAVQAETFISNAEKIHAPKSLNGSRSKRKIQVFLASYPKGPFRGAGYGFRCGVFDKNHDKIERVTNFLRSVIDF